MDILAPHPSPLRKPISTFWKTVVQKASVTDDSCAEGSTLSVLLSLPFMIFLAPLSSLLSQLEDED